ncbi:MAG: VCBS repeat-containing protein, partial [Calditrichaeota bacterium]
MGITDWPTFLFYSRGIFIILATSNFLEGSFQFANKHEKMMPRFVRRILFAGLYTFLLLEPLLASGLFQVYDLSYKGELISYQVEDLNADGLQDIILFTTKKNQDGASERWLSIYPQHPAGFDNKPLQSFRVPAQVILFDLGNIAAGPEKEMVYYGPGGVYYFAFQDSGFVLQPHKLFDDESLFLLSDRKTLRHWDFVRDFNQDGLDDVFIPEFHKAVLYLREAANGHNSWERDELALWPQVRVFGYFDPRFSVGHKGDALYSTPYLILADANGDQRKDFLAVYKDSLVIFHQKANHTFGPASDQKLALNYGDIWRGAKIQRTHLDDRSERQFLMRLADANHDGFLDVISVKVSTKESLINPKTEVLVYLGKPRHPQDHAHFYFPAQPDQVVRPEGTLLVLDILDLNHDDRLDLLMPVVKVGLSRIIKMLFTRTIPFQNLFYLMDGDGRYPEKPNHSTRMSMRFSFRGGAASPVYEIADFNG